MRTNNVILNSLNVNISAKVEPSSNTLRQLIGTLNTEDLPVSCSLTKDSKPQDTAYGLNCISDVGESSKPLGMELSADTPIQGLPDPADPDKIEVITDYSSPANIKQLGSLSQITIKDNGIDGSDCEDFGNFTIFGKIIGQLQDINDKVVIPFSSPDSSGLCDVEINGNDITMYCYNRETFDPSPIIIEQTIVKDLEGKNRFILKSSIQKSFGCSISVNSTVNTNENPPNSSNSSSIPSYVLNTTINSEETSKNFFRYNKSSNGLSGGVIAALVIIFVVLIAILVGVFLYCRRNKKAEIENSQIVDSTCKQIIS